MPVSTIPPEIWSCHIFSELSGLEVFKAALTCKRWYDTITTLGPKPYIRYENVLELKERIQELEERIKNVCKEKAGFPPVDSAFCQRLMEKDQLQDEALLRLTQQHRSMKNCLHARYKRFSGVKKSLAILREMCGELYDEAPILELGDRRGNTDWIDFITPRDLDPHVPLVKGTDQFGRSFIAIQMVEVGYEKERLVHIVFQRYAKGSLWVNAGGRGRIVGCPDCLVDRGVPGNILFYRALSALLREGAMTWTNHFGTTRTYLLVQ